MHRWSSFLLILALSSHSQPVYKKNQQLHFCLFSLIWQKKGSKCNLRTCTVKWQRYRIATSAAHRPHSDGFLPLPFTLCLIFPACPFFPPQLNFFLFTLSLLFHCFPHFRASISTIMTFIRSDTATVEVSLTLVTLNAKRRRALRCGNTPAQCWQQSVHSAAVNTGRYVKPVCGSTRSVLIIIIVHGYYKLTPHQHTPFHLQFSPSFPFLICALQVCSENSWCITEGTCCSLCACLWVCVCVCVCVCEDKVRGKNSEKNHYSLLTHDSAGVAWLSNLSHLN